jgi:hypothetical protein
LPPEPSAAKTEADSPAPSALTPAKPKLSIDPLDVDPEGLDLGTLLNGPPKDPIAESHLPAEPPVKNSTESSPAAPPAKAPPVGPAASQAVRRDDQSAVGAPAAVAPLLVRKLPAIKFDRIPLCRAIDLAVQFSGLPISVSPDELRMASVSAATPVSLDAKDATIESLLDTAFKPLRLHSVVDKDQITLERIGEDKNRTVDYAVDDLVAAGMTLNELSAAIPQLVVPESWQANGGAGKLTVEGGKLHIEQAESLQYEILVLLERCRATLGLPTRSKYPSHLITPGSNYAGVMERLSAPTTFTFADYVPLRGVFRYWQEEMQVAVLVDWPSLETERLWPNTRIACAAAGKPWAESLDTVLEPLGLCWRAVDPRTIQITSRDAAARQPEVEVYRLNKDANANPEQLMARLKDAAAANDSPTSSAIIFQPITRLLLVRQPPAVHRQIVATMGDLLEQAKADK